MPLKNPFSTLRGWLIDMDGVIYRGDQPTPGAAAFVGALQEGGHRFIFLTNNATKTPHQFVDKLATMDIHVGDENVFTSPLATVAYLVHHLPPPRRLLVVGGEGIQRAVVEAGYQIVQRAEESEVVVAGLDQQVTYEHLAEAALAIGAGCPWIGTNGDLTLPSERGDVPGAGALLALLEASTGRKPLVIGKPATGMYEQAIGILGTGLSETVMLGDRLETDILGGHSAGIRTLCVLTGVASRADAEAYDPHPDWIVPDLTHLLLNGGASGPDLMKDSTTPQLLDLTRAEFRDLMALWGEPAFRGDQVYSWLHKDLVTSAEEMTNLPKALRTRLEAKTKIALLELITQVDSHDRLTRKALFRLPDGNTIEVVLMLYNERRTVCISTQVGCGMGCTFCATGQGGLARNLSAGEIIAQVHWFDRWLRKSGPNELRLKRPSRLTNIVVMGMGEPLANYKPLMQALRAVTDQDTFGLSVRNITVSTVGLVPMIDRLATEQLAVKLAVSLHAPSNRLRNRLVPINKTYPLEALLAACQRYQTKTRRRVTFEYALMAGINDAPDQAQAMADILVGLRCHINLIPLNPTPGSQYQPSSDEDVRRFRQVLENANIPTTVRLRRGIEINAGCGQLRQAVQQPDMIPLLS